jgi:hypothetical protein
MFCFPNFQILYCPVHFSGCLGFKLPLWMYVAPFGQALISTIFIFVVQGVLQGAWGHVGMSFFRVLNKKALQELHVLFKYLIESL